MTLRELHDRLAALLDAGTEPTLPVYFGKQEVEWAVPLSADGFGPARVGLKWGKP